jgi:cephalosporin-C deacetylase-like acetyl esterase
MKSTYDSLWRAIIRPPRAVYTIKELGPTEQDFDGLNTIVRTDLTLEGTHGHKIYCSHFEPEESEREYDLLPCVIYLHGNSSCRLEAL